MDPPAAAPETADSAAVDSLDAAGRPSDPAPLAEDMEGDGGPSTRPPRSAGGTAARSRPMATAGTPPGAPVREAAKLRPGEPAPNAKIGAEYEPWSPPEGDPPLRFERPEHVRGIYLNAWTSGSSRRTASLIELANRTEVNAFVIDVKDATGYVSHRSRVPLAREIGATDQIRIRDLPGLLQRLHDAGIYPIARIVIVKDPLLIAHRPDWAIQDTAGGVWVDGKDFVWLNPFDKRVWDYHLDLAKEMASLGFPEIQWDYVRFPDAPGSEIARAAYPGRNGQNRTDAIRGFLRYTRDALEPLRVEVTADVFGVTTSAGNDVGIGQLWETFIDQVDVALPMVYPSHYWRGSFGIQRPNAHPYEIIRAALGWGVRRSEGVDGAGKIRPWLQDFTLGKPAYGAPEVRAQIEATYDVGIDEWILWSPSSRYTEEALRPVGGWQSPPMMRLADMVVRVDRRFAVMDSIARAAVVADSLAAFADSVRRNPPPVVWDSLMVDPRVLSDSVSVDLPIMVPLPDSIPVDTIRPDTVRSTPGLGVGAGAFARPTAGATSVHRQE